ncbi:pirin family protein [Thalassotalea euphylliae]|uniref:Pirin family protein n=1 Tax=Thalassotalea euphylliae TaxID=1655234 RepID=A0A3E0TZJ6_9GAMM|nr:pirin-like bicupin family protein [Thalassotalea euphylliae]REL30086.1 pirin family protein [Thalassotalea euphylliae]
MIKHIPYQQLGKADHGWLKANHHFSFAHYYNPKRMGFGTLRVINDDWVAAGTGFPPHPHKNMEIISFIRSGAITHQDSVGNKGITPAGEVQVMSAGTGIVHSEYNLSKEPLTLYQIWIEPNQHNVKPRWDSKRLSQKANSDSLPLLVSGFKEDKDKALFIHQEARIFGGKLAKGTQFEHEITHQAYILASSGSVDIIDGNNLITLAKGDGAEVTRQQQIVIEAHSDAELIIIDAPVH